MMCLAFAIVLLLLHGVNAFPDASGRGSITVKNWPISFNFLFEVWKTQFLHNDRSQTCAGIRHDFEAREIVCLGQGSCPPGRSSISGGAKWD